MKQSENLIGLYLESCLAGKTPIPYEYHLWCCFSLIAAALSDRVFVDLWGREPANLYTFLVGDSASGKGTAIKHIKHIVSKVQMVNAMLFRGTAPALLDAMSSAGEASDEIGRPINKAQIYLITPELKDNIGSGPQAENFVGWATDNWEGERDLPKLEGTRNAGGHAIVDPMINWLAGTTKEWLIESVSKTSIQGGFFGRVACIYVKDQDIRMHARLEKPDNYDEINAKVVDRIRELTNISGPLEFSDEAYNIFDNWQMSRPKPDGPIGPIWKRLPQLVLKLTIIHALADRRQRAQAVDVERSLQLATSMLANVQNVVTYASVTPKTEIIYRATIILKQNKKMPQSMLIKQLGATIDDVTVALRTLQASKSIRIVSTKNGGKNAMVEWIGY